MRGCRSSDFSRSRGICRLLVRHRFLKAYLAIMIRIRFVKVLDDVGNQVRLRAIAASGFFQLAR